MESRADAPREQRSEDQARLGRIAEKLAPASIKATLIRAGALLSGYELVKSSILEQVRSFYSFNFENGEWITDPQYDVQVLALDPRRRPFAASVAWLVAGGAISAEQAAALERIRDHRHDVGHELVRFLSDPDADVDVDLLRRAGDTLRDLGRFWGGISADTDPDYDHTEVDYDGIRSLNSIMYDYVLEVAGLPSEPLPWATALDGVRNAAAALNYAQAEAQKWIGDARDVRDEAIRRAVGSGEASADVAAAAGVSADVVRGLIGE